MEHRQSKRVPEPSICVVIEVSFVLELYVVKWLLIVQRIGSLAFQNCLVVPHLNSLPGRGRVCRRFVSRSVSGNYRLQLSGDRRQEPLLSAKFRPFGLPFKSKRCGINGSRYSSPVSLSGLGQRRGGFSEAQSDFPAFPMLPQFLLRSVLNRQARCQRAFGIRRSSRSPVGCNGISDKL